MTLPINPLQGCIFDVINSVYMKTKFIDISVRSVAGRVFKLTLIFKENLNLSYVSNSSKTGSALRKLILFTRNLNLFIKSDGFAEGRVFY